MNGKKNLLITANRSISSKYVFNTLCDIAGSFYTDFKDEYNVYFLSQYSTKKKVISLFNKENRELFFDEIILLKDYTNVLDYSTAENWEEIYNNFDLKETPKFDKVIEIGSALSDGTNLQKGKVTYKSLFLNKGQFKYFSVRQLKEVMLLTLKICKTNDITLEHFIIDPQEVDYSDFDKELKYKRYFGYSDDKLNFQRNDAFLNHYKSNSHFEEKEFDFVFGYSVLTKDRVNNIYDILQEKLKDKNIKMFLKDKFNNIDTFIKKDEYLKYIRKAKFTLIIPAYDSSTFSIFRYIESIYNGCLPLILNTNNLDEVKKSFYVPDEIVIDIKDIDNVINRIDSEKMLNTIIERMKNE